MNLPYLPLFVDDYEAATAHLSLIEDGIYTRLLRLCWRSQKCQMPNDHEWIARKIRVASEKERDAMAAVLDEFFTTRKRVIFSKRLSSEYERIHDTIRKRKEAGKTGGLAKSRKTQHNPASKASVLLQHPDPEPEPYEKAKAFSKRASAPKKSFRDEIMEAWENV